MRMLLSYVNTITKETQRQLRSRDLYRLDGFSEDLTVLIEAMLEFSDGLTRSMTLRLPDVYAQVNIWQDRQWRLVVKSGTGASLPSSQTIPPQLRDFGKVTEPQVLRTKFGMGVDVYRSEPWLAQHQANWIAQNTSLIKTIEPQYMGKVENIVRQGVMNGTSPRELAAQVEHAGNITASRAKIIARDQISKANSELTMYRQKELGIEEYTWSTSMDERVRPTHRAHEGRVYKWSEPPANTGHPGHEVLCRCDALPVFKD